MHEFGSFDAFFTFVFFIFVILQRGEFLVSLLEVFFIVL